MYTFETYTLKLITFCLAILIFG